MQEIINDLVRLRDLQQQSLRETPHKAHPSGKQFDTTIDVVVDSQPQHIGHMDSYTDAQLFCLAREVDWSAVLDVAQRIIDRKGAGQ